MASCTRSAPKDSCTRWISRRGRASGARTRCGATAWPRHSSARGARRSSRTARVIANIGGKGAGIVAFDAKTGKVQWTATDDEASYSSAVGATIGGRRYAVFLTRTGLVGLDPATGRVQFQRRWRARQAASVNAATPLVIGDLIFISAQYGPGAATLRYDGSSLSELWASDDVAVESLRDERAPRRVSVRLSRPPGVRSQLPRGRVAHRQGPVESGWVSGGQRRARRQSAGDSPRKR